MKIKSACPWCDQTTLCERVLPPRGPGRQWVRLKCKKCKQEFEHHLTDHKVPT